VGDVDEPHLNNTGKLDRANGHGTFVTGLVHRRAPAASLQIDKVLSTFGDGDDYGIARGLNDLQARLGSGVVPDILNCSFAGHTDHDEWPLVLWDKLSALMAKGVVIVAAAGNGGESRVNYPAALPGVYAVAALTEDLTKRAPWSNHGDWVDLCAPGTNVVSTFFGNPGPPTNGGGSGQLANFHGWAAASGTSFATPYVAGAIAATQRACNLSAPAAIAELIKQAKQVENMAAIPAVASPCPTSVSVASSAATSQPVVS
jgi:subtilisin family serine protease